MENLARALHLVEAAAKRGAMHLTRNHQIVSDAADDTVRQWEQAILSGKTIQSLAAWAFKVAQHRVRRLGGRRGTLTLDAGDLDGSHPGAPYDGPLPAGEQREIRAALVEMRLRLRGRMFEVVSKLLEPDMSLHRAARDLGMDRKSLKRSFERALGATGSMGDTSVRAHG
ncbi:MAG: hypothetical protein JNK78_00285 [Planctomycetes bacterium]|nr:hypothetical protein [Planctomycetota bacterium]